MFVLELKKLLDQATLNLDPSTREQLLLHQLLSGLPNTVSRKLRATGEMKTLQTAVDRVRPSSVSYVTTQGILQGTVGREMGEGRL